jgi:hypothetical protein
MRDTWDIFHILWNACWMGLKTDSFFCTFPFMNRKNSLCQMKTSVFLGMVTMHDNTQLVMEIKLPPERVSPWDEGVPWLKKFRNDGVKFYYFIILYLKLYFIIFMVYILLYVR